MQNLWSDADAKAGTFRLMPAAAFVVHHRGGDPVSVERLPAPQPPPS